jgi:hypothetical protein
MCLQPLLLAQARLPFTQIAAPLRATRKGHAIHIRNSGRQQCYKFAPSTVDRQKQTRKRFKKSLQSKAQTLRHCQSCRLQRAASAGSEIRFYVGMLKNMPTLHSKGRDCKLRLLPSSYFGDNKFKNPKMFKESKWGTEGLESMMGDPEQPLTLADFDDYILRLGRTSPTPADAMRFAVFQMHLEIQEHEWPKLILRRFMIDRDGTAEAALHARTKVPLEILRQMKAAAALIVANPDSMAKFMADLAPIYLRGSAPPLQKGTFTVMKPVFPKGPPNCAHCQCGDTESRKLKFCVRCRSVRYCCVDHQKADWPLHKTVCKEPK